MSVMPSQVVRTIDEIYPLAKGGNGIPIIGSSDGFNLLGILNLVKAVPEELINLSPYKYSLLVRAISTIEHQLDAWVYRDQMTTMVGVSGVDVITVLRSCLAECRDEYPPPSTVDLMFIPNDDPRDSIRDDIGGANRALQNAEWKASTVIAGAAIEALLLWAIQQPEVQERLEPAVSAAVSRGIIRSEHKHKPERWDLTQYIEIAAEMKLIRADTKSSASLAKEFRNLIHPGRAARLKQECNRGTAMSAVAGLEHIVHDLTTRKSD